MINKLLKPFRIVADIFELYIPAIAFLVLFISFILQIASRYIFRHPLIWPYELSQFAYLWLILLGTCYADRTKENIVFSIVYDSVSRKIQFVFDILNHVIVVFFLGISIPATIKFYQFYMTRYSTVFKFPLGIVYFAFAPFIFFTILRNILEFINCVKNRQKNIERGI